jgi:hypothetical protein
VFSSWEADRYLQDRVHDAWLPDGARQQVRQIIKRIQVQSVSNANMAGRMSNRDRSCVQEVKE